MKWFLVCGPEGPSRRSGVVYGVVSGLSGPRSDACEPFSWPVRGRFVHSGVPKKKGWPPKKTSLPSGTRDPLDFWRGRSLWNPCLCVLQVSCGFGGRAASPAPSLEATGPQNRWDAQPANTPHLPRRNDTRCVAQATMISRLRLPQRPYCGRRTGFERLCCGP